MNDPAWEVCISLRRSTETEAERIAAALAPEAAREVPRATAELRRPEPHRVEVRIEAGDTSACRAALNTYLAWIGLVLATETAAAAPRPPLEPAPSARSRSA